MLQLTGLDSAFLSMETATTFGHVSSLIVYERPEAEDFNPYQAYKAQILRRLDRATPFRRRLVEVPFGLDHPYWVTDPDFDLNFHVRHIAVPPPGEPAQLQELVARLVARPLDRKRPLWEVYVIEGLPNETFAVLTKIHHAAVDGAVGAQMTIMLLDGEADHDISTEPVPELRSEPIPTDAELLARTGRQLVGAPRKIARLQIKLLREVASNAEIVAPVLNLMADAIRRGIPGVTPAPRRSSDRLPGLPTAAAPATPLNQTITAERLFSYRSFPLADIKALKNAFGCTINDVVMAICTGGLRRYLVGHDALPDEPLVSMIPVSIRSGDEADPWTNRVSSLFVPIPTNEADPKARLAALHETMVAAKKQHELLPADTLIDVAQVAPPALSHQAALLSSRLRLADRIAGVANVVISNVPGPRTPLYFGGARMKHFYPISIVTDGQGLNITVQSYVDWLDVGLLAAANVVPDLDDLMNLLHDELNELLGLAGLSPSGGSEPAAERPGGPPPPELKTTKRRTAKPGSAKKPAVKASKKTQATTPKASKKKAKNREGKTAAKPAQASTSPTTKPPKKTATNRSG